MKAGLFIFIAAVVIGSVAGLGFVGVINIPGLTPVKKKAAADAKAVDDLTKQVEKAAPAKQPEKAAPKIVKPASTNDPEEGAKKLAKLWNEVETPKLVALVKDWKDADAANVFSKMDPEKVAEVLGALEPKRGSGISQLIKKQASVVKPDEL